MASDEKTSQPKRARVAVVFGGRSSEHGVSCLTAGEVIRAIDPDKYEVVPIGISTEGKWVLESATPERYALTEGGSLPAVDAVRAQVALASGSGSSELVVHEPDEVPRTLGEVDVVLPLLHGPWGEDGTIQGLFEMAGVKYVGAGVLASAVGMDKHYMKIVFASAGLPMLPHAVVQPREWEHDRSAVRETVASLGYPVFVKPARGGSSIGITRVEDAHDLDAAIKTAREHDPKVIIEAAAIGAREIECGVLQSLDGRGPLTSVPGEIVLEPESGHTWYDFEAKYIDGGGRADVPAQIPEDVAARIREHSARAFDALGCEGLARVDYFYFPDGRIYLNEINTMPGFTPTSGFPMMWAATGMAYHSLVDHLLRLALRRDTGLR
jgi:D-alanine-D-alanine ligase